MNWVMNRNDICFMEEPELAGQVGDYRGRDHRGYIHSTQRIRDFIGSVLGNQ
jgi:hypothetical protein